MKCKNCGHKNPHEYNRVVCNHFNCDCKQFITLKGTSPQEESNCNNSPISYLDKDPDEVSGFISNSDSGSDIHQEPDRHKDRRKPLSDKVGKYGAYEGKDVAEAVTKLKEEFCDCYKQGDPLCMNCKVIDKIFGDLPSRSERK